MESCVKIQQQKLQCSSDEYALMKDNLLLFHHQNMVYLQHGDDDHMVHRMEYLVSIIFSHYDQNNDGLVERDELQLMWNTMDMHHVSNDSNCTLMDMLIYDDNNEDGVLTINEFNDAFHRISETVERQTNQVRWKCALLSVLRVFLTCLGLTVGIVSILINWIPLILNWNFLTSKFRKMRFLHCSLRCFQLVKILQGSE